MKVIQESPEHHFLTFLEKLKDDPDGWLGHHFALSQTLTHEDIIAKPEHIKGKLHKLREESGALLKKIAAQHHNDQTATLYQLTNGDIILLIRPQNESARTSIRDSFQTLKTEIGDKLCHKHNLAKDLYTYQKLADALLLSACKMKSYETLSDANRVHSIPLRRERRSDPVIMIVEDDRFTASYTANILNKEFDVILAKTGEEAIGHYIEHAPDMVFLDIHLPGLDGLETLQAIMKADPHAFIFMLSVDTVKHNIVTATETGAAGFLKKPFDKERLMTAVQKSPHLKKYKNKTK